MKTTVSWTAPSSPRSHMAAGNDVAGLPTMLLLLGDTHSLNALPAAVRRHGVDPCAEKVLRLLEDMSRAKSIQGTVKYDEQANPQENPHGARTLVYLPDLVSTDLHRMYRAKIPPKHHAARSVAEGPPYRTKKQSPAFRIPPVACRRLLSKHRTYGWTLNPSRRQTHQQHAHRLIRHARKTGLRLQIQRSQCNTLIFQVAPECSQNHFFVTVNIRFIYPGQPSTCRLPHRTGF